VTTETTRHQLPCRGQSGMRTRAVNAAAGVIQAAMEQGRQTPAGLAIALDSARLLNSPEHAAEFQRLLEPVAATPADEPASDLLLAELARNVRAVGRFDGPQWEDPYWCEHIAFLGKYTGQLLRRLLDAEARVGELENRLSEYERPADEDPIAYTLTETAPVTVYRAEHPDSGITLGHYGTEAAARAHCEATERNAWPKGTLLGFGWIRDALPEDEEDGIAELVVTAGQNEESTTGYIVIALDVPSAYDEGADQ